MIKSSSADALTQTTTEPPAEVMPSQHVASSDTPSVTRVESASNVDEEYMHDNYSTVKAFSLS